MSFCRALPAPALLMRLATKPQRIFCPLVAPVKRRQTNAPWPIRKVAPPGVRAGRLRSLPSPSWLRSLSPGLPPPVAALRPLANRRFCMPPARQRPRPVWLRRVSKLFAVLGRRGGYAAAMVLRRAVFGSPPLRRTPPSRGAGAALFTPFPPYGRALGVHRVFSGSAFLSNMKGVCKVYIDERARVIFS